MNNSILGDNDSLETIGIKKGAFMAGSSNRVLFISNGHGEDVIAARIISNLIKITSLQIMALPIVGMGVAYAEHRIPILFKGYNLPSGGFVRNGFHNLMMDLRAGLFGLLKGQIRALQQARRDVDLVVCVGDVLLIILAGLYLRRPIIFIPTAKSDYIAPHWRVERWLMRRLCVKIFTRDVVTARSLASRGLPAEFYGNVMMDCLDYHGTDLQGTENHWTIGVLPGSRLEAYENMADIAEVVLAFQKLIEYRADSRPARYLVALAGALSVAEIAGRLLPKEWVFQEPDRNEANRGVVGHLDYQGDRSGIRLTFAQGRFADILAASILVIGLAGTGNEQAVGLGKPVVTFVGRGTQFTVKFVKTQQKLLGEAIRVVDRNPETVAAAIFHILTDHSLRRRMVEVGRERMGATGGAQQIAVAIGALANTITDC